MENYEKAIKLLEKYNQNRLINILKNTNEENQNKLINQISKIDFEQVEDLYEDTKKELEFNLGDIKPIKSINTNKVSKEKLDEYKKLGENIVKNNQFAVATMAGGQGTRLGFNGPKGTFKIDVEPEPKYLYEIIVDTLKRANEKYDVIIPWYIMTSEENDGVTKAFLEEHKYFGYPKESVKFFTQGQLPLVSENGDLIVDENYNIKLASNGNGSIFESMRQKGILDDMKQKGVKWVYIGSIDNVLLKMVDTLLMGIAIDEGSKIATRSIFKNNPRERIGSLCSQDGKIKVIEYSELPEEMIEAVDEDGELLYGESHVMCNLFSVEALETISTKKLPYHSAHKKYAFLDENGKLITPEVPNAYKFEYFIFDSFEFFGQISILRGVREEDFAPVKNKALEGNVDSPITAAKLYNEYWKTHTTNV